MSHQIVDLEEAIVFQIEGTAQFRRDTAERFPDDFRNETAAKELDQLAGEVRGLQGSELHKSIERLWTLFDKVDGGFFEDLLETVSIELRCVGFHVQYDGPTFLAWYKDNLERLLRQSINGFDDGVAALNLDEAIENDPEVQAAKRALRQARAKARAEARKYL